MLPKDEILQKKAIISWETILSALETPTVQ
jgi:hypothetical protein